MEGTIEDYEILSESGKGSFSVVYHARHTKTGIDAAIKVIPKHNSSDPDHLLHLQREIDLLKSMDHPFIAQFYDLLEDEENFYVAIEYCEKGTLLNYINATHGIDEEKSKRIFCQLISVLSYLHSEKKVIHRDLKAENVLLDENFNIRLIDFGLSNSFSPGNPYVRTSCGSPAYASPEQIKGIDYTSISDVWSAGVLLYAMVMGALPFMDESVPVLLDKVLTTEPKYPISLSPSLRSILMGMLQKDPMERLTLTEVQNHPWVTSFKSFQVSDPHFGYENHWRLLDSPGSNRLFIDKELVEKLTALEYDCSRLQTSFKFETSSPSFAAYKMLRKNIITKQMAEIQTYQIPHLPIRTNRCLSETQRLTPVPVLHNCKDTESPSPPARPPIHPKNMIDRSRMTFAAVMKNGPLKQVPMLITKKVRSNSFIFHEGLD